MKRRWFALVWVAVALAVLSTCELFVPGGRWNPLDPAYDPTGDPNAGDAPEMAVLQDTMEVTSGTGSYDMGSAPVGSSTLEAAFTIENLGTAWLALTGTEAVAVSGAGAASFDVSSAPSRFLAPGGSTSFTVAFSSAEVGEKTAIISIANNDADENPYTFELTAYAIGSMNVKQGSANIPNGTGSYSFGSVVTHASSDDIVFVIQNLGSTALSLTGIPRVAVGGTDGSMFTIGTQPPSTIGAALSESFTLAFSPSSVGLKTATVTIENSTTDNNPYVFTVTGTGVEPDITVKDPAGTAIADGDATGYDFGGVLVLDGMPAVLTIQNTGTSTLSLVGASPVSIGGTNPLLFEVTEQPISSVAPGASTTFTVVFTPDGPGLKSATLSIASDDPDEDPYEFPLKGTGTYIPYAPSGLAATATSDTAIDLSWTDNSTNETGFKIERKTGAAGTYAQIGTVAADVTSYSDSGLTQNTIYYYRVRASNADGDSGYCAEASAKTEGVPDGTPSVLVATAYSANEIRLSWSEGISNETGFSIERKTGAGSFAEIATVSAGTTSYYDETSLSGGIGYTYRVRAYNTYGYSAYSNESSATTRNWSIQTVVAGDAYPYDTSMAINSSGYPRIVFTGNSATLRYVWWNGSLWTNELVMTGGQDASMILDGSGIPHISDQYNDTLNYAKRSPTWTSAVVKTPITDVYNANTAIAVDGSGGVHIVYCDHYLEYAYSATGGAPWTHTRLDTTQYAGYFADIALDTYGRVHISYYSNTGGVRYATNISGSWQTLAIDSTGSPVYRTSIAVTDGMTAYAVYTSATKVVYAYGSTAGWSTMTVATFASGTGSSAALAITSAAAVHIAYRGDSNLNYAYYSDGWVTEVVDSVGGTVGSNLSVALNSSNKPCISYRYGYDLRYAQKN